MGDYHLGYDVEFDCLIRVLKIFNDFRINTHAPRAPLNMKMKAISGGQGSASSLNH